MRKVNNIKDSVEEVRLFSRRILILGMVLLILLFVLLVRLVILQIIQHHFYMTLSRQNHISFVPLEPKRGLIFDRHGVLLAENQAAFSLEVTAGRKKEMEALVRAIKPYIHLSEQDISTFFRLLKQKRLNQDVTLKARLSEEEVAAFYVNQFRFPGVQIKAKLIRHYPEGEVFVSVIGYVGRINDKELGLVDPTNYAASNYIGKLGIEKFYESQLHGKVGYQEVEVDASGRVIRVLKRVSPIAGDNLYLSIDANLQRAAYEALKEENGALVALNPNNGEVLALVSHPSYDPNVFVTGISSQQYAELRSASSQPLYNRALRGQYSIGSTIKPFLALVALDQALISPEDEIYDPGYFQLKGNQHIYHDWKRTGHGRVNLKRAIAESCDTYFYQLALRLGIERIDEGLWDFGFGEATGIDIPDEALGLVATPEWKRKRLKMSWYAGDTINAVIGQGYMLATPLQLAHATAILAAKGQGYLPTLLYVTRSENGTWRKVIPRKEDKMDIDDESWEEIHRDMALVISSPSGTAHYLNRGLRYTMASKTGTAQVFSLKANQKYNASLLPKELRDNKLFIAFAPIESPKLAIAAVTEHSLEAGKVTRKVMDAYLQ